MVRIPSLIAKIAKLKLRDRVELIILDDKGRVLVGTNPRHRTAQLPGGGVDGASVNAAAKKEALEEAGVTVTGVRSFGVKPVALEVPNYKKGFDGHRTFWRTARYVCDSDERLGDDGDAMKGLKFMSIADAIARLKQPKKDGTHDVLAGSREAALLRLQTSMGGKVKTAYNWAAIEGTLARAKKLTLPKRVRQNSENAIGEIMGIEPRRTYALVNGGQMSPARGAGVAAKLKATRMLTPSSGGSGKWLQDVGPATREMKAMLDEGTSARGGAALGALSKQRLAGPSQKALGAVLQGHEMDELGELLRNKGRMSPVTAELGHASPRVLLREHNKLVTLPAEVRQPVSDAMRLVRTARDEDLVVGNGFQGFDYGRSPRLSRHAQKRMTESLERRAAD